MTRFYPVKHNQHAKATGEFHPPKKGEWFLSGSTVRAYKARTDLTQTYHIAVVVKTRTRTIIEEVTD